MSEPIVSAGGVVWKMQTLPQNRLPPFLGSGSQPVSLQVLLVHHTRHNDWGFPKGRVEACETYEHAALREVQEETGYHCKLGKDLSVLNYKDRNGRSKKVYFWAMEPLEKIYQPLSEEIDSTRWASLSEAEGLLSSRPQETFLLGALTTLISTIRPQQGRV